MVQDSDSWVSSCRIVVNSNGPTLGANLWPGISFGTGRQQTGSCGENGSCIMMDDTDIGMKQL